MRDVISSFLETVEKPARYCGGELGEVQKDPGGLTRFCFAFPDVYEVGMSHLGLRILYHMMNERQDTYCERVFAPWVDMEAQLRARALPLCTLETMTPMASFDLVGFTLQYEMSYTNILNMLDLAGIPVAAAERGADMPFVMAGGPCAMHAEPLSDVVDFFMLGDGEESMMALLDAYRIWKQSGEGREAFLIRVAKLDGAYVPKYYDVAYHEDGTVRSITPNVPYAPAVVRRAVVRDLDSAYYPKTWIVPYLGVVHDRITMEIFRGCTRGCRFCQAGMLYRPVRERRPETLLRIAEALIEATGYEEISLSSLSSGDYSQLIALARALGEKMRDKRVSLSLPSLRIDSFAKEMAEEVGRTRKSSLTFAPEAGTQRLRDVINKNVSEADLLSSVADAFGAGYSALKLYFMIGLPTETPEDIEGIAALARRVVEAYYAIPKGERPGKLRVAVSTSSFVPKPFTPFQWDAQDAMDTLARKQNQLKALINGRAVTYNWHDAKVSFLEAVFARGDRRMGKALRLAWEKGCRFDGWAEHFRYDKWMEAFAEAGLDPSFYANRERQKDEIFPWNHINARVSRAYLWAEREKAMRAEPTMDCRQGCLGCGMDAEGGPCACG